MGKPEDRPESRDAPRRELPRTRADAVASRERILEAAAALQDSLVKTVTVSDERVKAGVSLLVGALERLRRL